MSKARIEETFDCSSSSLQLQQRQQLQQQQQQEEAWQEVQPQQGSSSTEIACVTADIGDSGGASLTTYEAASHVGFVENPPARLGADTLALSEGSVYLGGSATFGTWRRTGQELQDEILRESMDGSNQVQDAEPLGSLESDPPQNWFTRRCPGLHDWLAQRFFMSSRKAVFVMVGFILASMVKFLATDSLESASVNHMSVVVFSQLCSGFVALTVCFCMEGSHGRGTVHYFSLRTWRRFLGVAGMFTLATLNLQNAWDLGASSLATNTVGFAFVPMSALFSVVILERTYGMLEWFSIGIMTLAVMTFLDLRGTGIAGSDIMGTINPLTLVLVLASASVSALASVLAERIYKGRSRRIALLQNENVSSALQRPSPRNDATGRGTPYHVYKFHLDCASLFLSVGVWLTTGGHIHGGSTVWFGDWTWRERCRLALLVVHSWFAGWVTKEFSTVTRAIIETLINVLLIFMVKPMLGEARPYSGSIPSALLALVIVIAAVVFQTGRLNVQALLARMPASVAERRRSLEADRGAGSQLAQSIRQALSPCSLGRHCLTYGSMIAFIVADASRTLSQQRALSGSMITPQTMVLACYGGGIVVASTLIVVSLPGCGWSSLRQAYSPWRILRYLPCGLLFALSSTMLAAAYALGISPALSTALGYLYIPVAALASRFVLGKYYMWLEWLALAVLTFTCGIFGFLQYFLAHGSDDGSGSHLLAMLFVVASACASVMASLVSERVLHEEDHLPFRVQKVSLDIGSLIGALVLMPIIGFVSTRPQDAFWKVRFISQKCADANKVCWEKSSSGYCSNPHCTCPCSNAFWVAWDSWWVIMALAVNVLQGWLTGVVIKQFSTVLRAIAQGTTILAIYFVGDPLINHRPLNLTLTLIALIVPLSTALFNIAVSETEKVMALVPAAARHASPQAARTTQSARTAQSGSLGSERALQTW